LRQFGMRVVIITVALLAAGALSLVALTAWSGTTRDFYPPALAYAFVPGIALALIEAAIPSRALRARSARRIGALHVGLGVALLACDAGFSPGAPALHALLVTGGTALLLAGPLTLQWGTGTSFRTLDNSVMHWLGKRSYGIYLIHHGLIREIARHTQNLSPENAFGVLLIIGGGATIALSAALYHWWESPFLRLKSSQAAFPPRGIRLAHPQRKTAA
jgi:peptidoglycan/LPS O-acetylase OafA/YrhL